MIEGEQMQFNETPWPSIDETPIKPLSDEIMAMIRHDKSNHLSMIADEYKASADELVDSYLANGERALHRMYPVLFLYRHYLELQMKTVLMLGEELSLDPSKDTLHHKLIDLWNCTKTILVKVWPDGETQSLNNFGHGIENFSSVDPIGTSFRYSHSKTGEPLLPTVEAVDLRHLKESMNRMAGFLEGVVAGLSAYMDAANGNY